MDGVAQRVYRAHEVLRAVMTESAETTGKRWAPGMRVPVTLLPALFGGFGMMMLVVGLVQLDFTYPAGGPGPGFFPVLAGGAIVVLSVALGIRELQAAHRDPEEAHSPASRIHHGERLTRVLVAIVLGVALMNVIGAVPAIFIMVLWILKVIEGQPWFMSVTTALAIAAMTFFLFEVALEIPLPGRLASRLGF